MLIESEESVYVAEIHSLGFEQVTTIASVEELRG